MSKYHTPVLLQEVMEGLQVTAGKRFIDATLGGGGHTLEMLKRGCFVLGIDEDGDAIRYVQEKFEIRNSKFETKKQLTIVQGNFRNIEEIAKNNGFETVDGVLFDLGVSSHQLDTHSRGFSYRFDEAPLDMRFGDRDKLSACDIVNKNSEEELFDIFSRFGEEEKALDIARSIISSRKKHKITRVGELRKCLSTKDVDTVARIFQALRIAVNDELEALQAGLAGAMKVIKPGGRIAVISFHSLEDRIVKRFFLNNKVQVIGKKPIIPNIKEQQENKRSRSAKLRIAEKI